MDSGGLQCPRLLSVISKINIFRLKWHDSTSPPRLLSPAQAEPALRTPASYMDSAEQKDKMCIRDRSVSFRMYDHGSEQTDLKVISDLHLTVRPGEIVAIAGSSDVYKRQDEHTHSHDHSHHHHHSSLHDIEHIVRGHLKLSMKVQDDVCLLYTPRMLKNYREKVILHRNLP